MTYQAVIFDLDNTLLDRKKSLHILSKKLHKKYIHPDYTEERVYANLLTADGDGYQSKKDIYNYLSENLPWISVPSFDQFQEFWNEEFPASSVLMDGALGLITYLKRGGYKLAIITNGKKMVQDRKIDSVMIREYFDIIHISQEVGLKKPEKAIFELTLKRLSVDAVKAIYVGDHPSNDVYGAINAGLNAIWLEGFSPWDETLEVSGFQTIKKLEEIRGYCK
ncbi:HAD family hydrolase [Paenibacillus sp. sptzw28]|uniref:HAD family hydrolase n=1 Tax=Paenibacillus sp. sptzw28 TaxID=715179 RepID=UPI001C6F4200|nr:HAD family hydrolase [Paenibacillus sp. sptzw28]QYR19328.1 HAD family hydrolase [Paenibacillus sp. sptzw28]